MEHEGFNLSST